MENIRHGCSQVSIHASAREATRTIKEKDADMWVVSIHASAREATGYAV